MSYPGHSFESLTPLQRYSRCILQPQPSGQTCVLEWILGVPVNAYVCMYVLNPSSLVGWDVRSIFLTELTVWNSEFSISKTNCCTKIKESSLLYYLPNSRKKNIWIRMFPNYMSAIWNANSLVQDLNSDLRIHLLQTLIIATRTSVRVHYSLI